MVLRFLMIKIERLLGIRSLERLLCFYFCDLLLFLGCLFPGKETSKGDIKISLTVKRKSSILIGNAFKSETLTILSRQTIDCFI